MASSDSFKYFTINILVSSYGDRLADFLKKIPNKVEGVKYIIGHQGNTGLVRNENIIKRDDIIYYSLPSIGVTKSRNFLLESSSADILYFCDDDISLEVDFFSTLRLAHNTRDETVITFVVNNDKGKPRKSFPSKSKARSKWSILSVGTIEISLKRNNSLGIRFPEDMGAGSKYPIGDEAVFLSRFLNKGRRIYFENKVICSHPDDSSGAAVDMHSIYSRGLTIRRVFPFLSFFISIPFFILRRHLFILEGHYYKGFIAFIRGVLQR
ncbi:glycosyltransferase family A protein [Aeromonas veronii]|uniref:glycosyltransferase family A protein n=1 Tax=Aeromonas veronii TaxID=654 RepID=UPI002B48739F|nr:glycosyltransferase family A protein [Aeromonas veronii]